ncbi:CGNR zinc finger domain-containing protein [Nocardiopsis alba]|uniref:CGNR zinc finger domain-containing protein n=1 Tax=Nocardiopsis alba TaxID=53437 RepID=UPI0035DABCDA
MNFSFVSGDPALDLAGTVGSRRNTPVDLLNTPSDLERWVASCEGLPDGVAVDPEGLASALSLREAIYRLALDRIAERPFTPDDLAVLNAAAAGPPPTVELDDEGVRVSGGLAQALAQVARGAIALLADPEAALKECGRPDCTRLYLDRSRGARRTWCGMDECGNRMKAAAYRARRRARAHPDAGE